jgi:hypothetical protein
MRFSSCWFRRGLFLFIALSVFVFALATHAAVNVGRVLDVSEEWRQIENGRDVGKVQRGQGIESGNILRPRTDRGRVVIHLRNDRVITCEANELKECGPFVLSRQSSVLGRFFGAISILISPWSGDIVPVITRPPGDHQGLLQEAVVEIDGGKLDLSPAFERMRAGHYFVRVVRMNGDSVDRRLDQVEVKWESDLSLRLSVPEMAPGLYRLLLLDETRDHEPAGAQAWILVSDPKRFQKNSSEFHQALIWTRQWSERSGPNAQQVFLRSYLNYLIQPHRK